MADWFKKYSVLFLASSSLAAYANWHDAAHPRRLKGKTITLCIRGYRETEARKWMEWRLKRDGAAVKHSCVFPDVSIDITNSTFRVTFQNGLHSHPGVGVGNMKALFEKIFELIVESLVARPADSL